MNLLNRMGVAALIATVGAGSVQAGIADGTYLLHNHPDGGAQPPLYGFRLDGLNGDTSSIFTFDFDYTDGNRSSLMMMTVDQTAGTIRIFGEMFGGLNEGTGYDSSTTDDQVGWWSVDFTYDTDVRMLGGDDDTVAGPDTTTDHDGNRGTLSRVDGFGTTSLDGSYELLDYPPTYDWTFRLGDEDDDNGHRGHDGISGWGWVNHSGYGDEPLYDHVAASDWLFTAEKVPAPAAAWLAFAGLGLFGAVRRRKDRQ